MSRIAEADSAVGQTIVACKTCAALTEVTKREAAELRELLATRSSSHMARVFAHLGYEVTESSVRRHRSAHEPG